jgi:NAD(P)-dependent dehydrogenase (short-subunit alcohol dehydrogenase family)
MNTIFDLSGQTALITGASSGLGAQFAKSLSAAGARVILVARRLEKLQTLEQEIPNSLPISLDITSKQSISETFETLELQGERISICVNSAGIARQTSIFEDDPQNNFSQIFETNILGLWNITKAAANHMRNHNISGSIINIASVNGQSQPSLMGAAYNASKAAVIQLTKGLVGQLAAHNIRINAISPGFFPTEMTADLLKNFEESIRTKIPLNFIPELSDLNGALLFLASKEASRYVTGSTITVDGGISWGGINLRE